MAPPATSLIGGGVGGVAYVVLLLFLANACVSDAGFEVSSRVLMSGACR
jgi:hypothetical protein